VKSAGLRVAPTPERQCTDCVLLVRPASFYANPETIASNAFQSVGSESRAATLAAAQREFDDAVRTLTDAGVRVAVLAADAAADTPDAVFPNNWFSTHDDGTLVLYPMAAANRRRERQPQRLTELARTEGWRVQRTLDLTQYEQQAEYLEGTGSLVLERTHRIAYATLSARTSATVLNAFCRALDYRAISFRSRDRSGQPVYHTNVLMSVGPTLAILCSALFARAADARAVSDQLQGDGKQLLDLSSEQIDQLAGNVLFLDGGSAGPVLAVSTRAWQALSAAQRKLVELHARPALCSIDTIERCGGGGIRCMIAEIFLPRQGA
jgi:hypothetical protein